MNQLQRIRPFLAWIQAENGYFGAKIIIFFALTDGNLQSNFESPRNRVNFISSRDLGKIAIFD